MSFFILFFSCVLKLACQDKDKVSDPLCVVPWGSHWIVLFFLLSQFPKRHFSSLCTSCWIPLFVLGLSYHFFLFISFCMISESWWKSFFDHLFESSCSTSTSFTSCFLLRFSIYSLCKIFLGKAQMLKGIFPFSYILFPEAEADKQFPTLLQISQPGMV